MAKFIWNHERTKKYNMDTISHFYIDNSGRCEPASLSYSVNGIIPKVEIVKFFVGSFPECQNFIDEVTTSEAEKYVPQVMQAIINYVVGMNINQEKPPMNH